MCCLCLCCCWACRGAGDDERVRRDEGRRRGGGRGGGEGALEGGAECRGALHGVQDCSRARVGAAGSDRRERRPSSGPPDPPPRQPWLSSTTRVQPVRMHSPRQGPSLATIPTLVLVSHVATLSSAPSSSQPTPYLDSLLALALECTLEPVPPPSIDHWPRQPARAPWDDDVGDLLDQFHQTVNQPRPPLSLNPSCRADLLHLCAQTLDVRAKGMDNALLWVADSPSSSSLAPTTALLARSRSRSLQMFALWFRSPTRKRSVLFLHLVSQPALTRATSPAAQPLGPPSAAAAPARLTARPLRPPHRPRLRQARLCRDGRVVGRIRAVVRRHRARSGAQEEEGRAQVRRLSLQDSVPTSPRPRSSS